LSVSKNLYLIDYITLRRKFQELCQNKRQIKNFDTKIQKLYSFFTQKFFYRLLQGSDPVRIVRSVKQHYRVAAQKLKPRRVYGGFKALLQLRQPRNGKALSHWDTKKQPTEIGGQYRHILL
jgi:hypothetical protein